MHISINKDFEREYKDDFFKGFSLNEWISIASAFLVCGGLAFLLYRTFHPPLDVCVYAVVPVGGIIIGLGFYKYQGMGPIRMLREISWYRKTRHLFYDADEGGNQLYRKFTMHPVRNKKKINKKRRRI